MKYKCQYLHLGHDDLSPGNTKAHRALDAGAGTTGFVTAVDVPMAGIEQEGLWSGLFVSAGTLGPLCVLAACWLLDLRGNRVVAVTRP